VYRLIVVLVGEQELSAGVFLAAVRSIYFEPRVLQCERSQLHSAVLSLDCQSRTDIRDWITS